MDGTVVQRIGSSPDPQKTRTLLETLRPHKAHLFKFLPCSKSAILQPVFNDILRQRRAKPRHIGQQMLAGRIQIYTYMVHTAFYDAIQFIL